MSKGTKAFRIIISVLLGITMLFTLFTVAVAVVYIQRDYMEASYGIFVAGVDVTRDNHDDVLGDGTVFYDPVENVLTFENAEIEYDYSVVYSKVDLMVEFIGENKFVMAGEVVPVIHAANYKLSKNLVLLGEGSLTIEFNGECTDALGIYANNLRIETDITIAMPDCSNIANGIYCESSLILTGGANVTLDHGAAKYSTAVKARNNVDIETGSTLSVSTRPGSTELCRGLNVGGSLVVWENAVLNVSVDDAGATMSECIYVPGLLSVRDNAKVTALSKQAYGIECFGAVELNDGASISASSERDGSDILCYGAIVNYGGTVNGEVDALAGEYNK